MCAILCRCLRKAESSRLIIVCSLQGIIMRFFDTHAHLSLITDDPIDRLILIKTARRHGVKAIINVCNNLVDFDKAYSELVQVDGVYFAAGVSPTEVERQDAEWENDLDARLKLPRVIALGETGLDYFKKSGCRSSQIELFIKQLGLADKHNLPVIIHNRDSDKDLLDILQSHLPQRGGVLHCFSGDYALAYKATQLFDNLYLSFAGNLTWRTSRKLHEVAVRIPIERVIVESESPFMKPTIYRNKRTQPSHIHATVEYLAALRGEPDEEIAEILFKNACHLFQLSL